MYPQLTKSEWLQLMRTALEAHDIDRLKHAVALGVALEFITQQEFEDAINKVIASRIQ